jgi:DNA-binding beta-propeller fold protein YncE
VNGPRGTLDGTRYLRTFAPAEAAAFEWLNRTVPGIPVLCEAYGPSYQEFSRVSMNTGLPIVIGWEYHVFQRGHSRAEIERRIGDVKTIYTSADKAAVEKALSRYRVALVYVGSLERSTYAGANLARFAEWTDLFTPAYRNPEVTIFAVKGNFKGSVPVTAILRVEELPDAAARTGTAVTAAAQDAPGKVHQPRGVAFDTKGNVYVCDFANNRIQKLDTKLAPLAAWGRHGSAPGEFKDPCGVALGPGDFVFVADTWNSRVQVFDAQGKYLREWTGNFFGPRGVAVDRNGKVYVSDTGNSRVIRFDAEGNKELEIGKKGDGPGELREPNGLTVDRSGRVWVCDNGNARLVAFDKDGTFLTQFPVPGWKREVFSEPNVVADANGNLWVTVPSAREVRAYTPDGRFLKSIRSSPEHVFEKPVGIAIAPDGRLLISDIENRLVWVGTTK